MKKIAIAAVLTAGLALSACEANVKDEGELPSVDVDVSGDAGKLPEIDVETADVEVGSKEVTVDVPEVDVKMPSEK